MQVIIKKISEAIWQGNLKSQPLWKQIVINVCRFIHLIIVDLANGQLNLRAMSLVFTTILSFVPLIAVSFSVLKAFGVHNQIEPALLNLFSHLGDKAPELTNNIIGFVDNVEVGLLGTLGIAFLFYSVISLLTKVEEAFNYTWRIQKTRTLAERFSNYLSVLMVGPVLVIAAMGTTASLLNNSVTQSLASVEPFGILLEFVTKLIPYVLIIFAFTFVYSFVPNTKVRFIPALTGGIAAGILWQSVGYIYALVIAQSSTQTAIYAGFAIIFFFMTWLYLNWLILLVGSSVAFYRQYPEYLMAKNQSVSLNNHDREHVALNVLLMIGASFYNRQTPVSVEAIVDHLSCPKQSVEEVLQCYEDAGILQSVNAASSAYLPAVPLENLTVSEAYSAIRTSYAIFSPVVMHNISTDMALPIVDRVESSISRELGDLTIKQIVDMNADKSKNLIIAMEGS
ncbi:MAG: YihY/virulence factor BrkB family protein [Gammaproteobacteria bacterium]|nr:YihY/virulence factor BrkB family protein [Gammaproteobacteria bacterium]